MTAPRPFGWTILVVASVGAAAVVAIEIARPDTDNLPVVTGLLAFLASLLAYMKSQETHLSVNSRLDDMMRQAKAAARGEGVTQERARADKAKEDA